MTANNWYVITGAASTGKTTLVQALKMKGYRVVNETARTYIDQEIAKGRTIQEIRKNEQGFQHKVLEMKIEIEKHLPKEQIIFFDRGIPDTVAYDRLYGFPISTLLDQALQECSYKKIFILDQLTYEIDYARTESKEQQDILHRYLEQAYKDLGFPIMKVPVLEKEKRPLFILENL